MIFYYFCVFMKTVGSCTVFIADMNSACKNTLVYIYKVVAFVCVCVCVYNSPTAHTTGQIMTKPGMMMVPHLGMVHTIFQGQGQRSRSQPMYIYSPTAHTTGPIMTKPGMMMVPHLGIMHTIFQGQGQRSRSLPMYIYSPTAHTTGPIMTNPDMMMVTGLGMVHTIFQGQGQGLRVPAKRVPERTARSRAKCGHLCQ